MRVAVGLRRPGVLAFALAVVLLGAACGDGATDGSTSPSVSPGGDGTDQEAAVEGTPESSAPASEGGDTYFGGSLDDAYLQGSWCDSQDLTWTFEGNMVSVGAGRSGVGAVPISRHFSEPAATFVSREADMFVVSQLGEEIRFDRGACDSPGADAGSPGYDAAALVLCPALEPHGVDLAATAGFEATTEVQAFVDGCSVEGDAGAFVMVEMLPALESSIEAYAAGYEGMVTAALELGEDAVHVVGPAGEDHVVFELGGLYFVVGGATVEGPPQRARMIELALRVRELLMEANA